MTGRGDFMLDPAGRLRRRGEREVAPHLFAGIEILHRRLFDGAPARRLLDQPAVGQGDRSRAASPAWCMTASGSMSARRAASR